MGDRQHATRPRRDLRVPALTEKRRALEARRASSPNPTRTAPGRRVFSFGVTPCATSGGVRRAYPAGRRRPETMTSRSPSCPSRCCRPWPLDAREPVPSAIPAMPTLSDGALLERVARGDADAFTVLYRRFERPVFAMLLRLAGGRRAVAPRSGCRRPSPECGWARPRTTRRAARSGPGSTRSPSTPRGARWRGRGIRRRTFRSTRPGSTCRTKAHGRDLASQDAWTMRGRRAPSPTRSRRLPDFMREVVVLRCPPRAVVRRDRRGDGRPARGRSSHASTVPSRRCARPSDRIRERGPDDAPDTGRAARAALRREGHERRARRLRDARPPRLRRAAAPCWPTSSGWSGPAWPRDRRDAPPTDGLAADPRPHRGGPAGPGAAVRLAPHGGAVCGGARPPSSLAFHQGGGHRRPRFLRPGLRL